MPSKNIFTAILIFYISCSPRLAIEKTFSGWWAMTYWTFKFCKNGTYKRVSSGHYGFTEVKGNYEIHSDTIKMLSGFKNTNGTINEYYLLDKDSFLIDLKLFHDYKLQTDESILNYTCRVRYDVLSNDNVDSEIHKTPQ